jgi:hypothetical protein
MSPSVSCTTDSEDYVGLNYSQSAVHGTEEHFYNDLCESQAQAGEIFRVFSSHRYKGNLLVHFEHTILGIFELLQASMGPEDFFRSHTIHIHIEEGCIHT